MGNLKLPELAELAEPAVLGGVGAPADFGLRGSFEGVEGEVAEAATAAAAAMSGRNMCMYSRCER